MSTRLIEDCFIQEELAEQIHNRFITVYLEKPIMIIFDPYMINTEDIMRMRSGEINLVRLRRPAWGRADLDNCIKMINYKE